MVQKKHYGIILMLVAVCVLAIVFYYYGIGSVGQGIRARIERTDKADVTCIFDYPPGTTKEQMTLNACKDERWGHGCSGVESCRIYFEEKRANYKVSSSCEGGHDAYVDSRPRQFHFTCKPLPKVTITQPVVEQKPTLTCGELTTAVPALTTQIATLKDQNLAIAKQWALFQGGQCPDLAVQKKLLDSELECLGKLNKDLANTKVCCVRTRIDPLRTEVRASIDAILNCKSDERTTASMKPAEECQKTCCCLMTRQEEGKTMYEVNTDVRELECVEAPGMTVKKMTRQECEREVCCQKGVNKEWDRYVGCFRNNGNVVDLPREKCRNVCGDGLVQPPETCEPPNTKTCNAQCQKIPPRCGDGDVNQLSEQCEPPNTDTCDAQCRLKAETAEVTQCIDRGTGETYLANAMPQYGGWSGCTGDPLETKLPYVMLRIPSGMSSTDVAEVAVCHYGWGVAPYFDSDFEFRYDGQPCDPEIRKPTEYGTQPSRNVIGYVFRNQRANTKPIYICRRYGLQPGYHYFKLSADPTCHLASGNEFWANTENVGSAGYWLTTGTIPR